MKTAGGRNRYKAPGALNFCGKKVTPVTSETYTSAGQVILLMEKPLTACKDKVLAPVLDNAAYQRCAKASVYAKEQGTGLVFLPPYSPNLNPTERL